MKKRLLQGAIISVILAVIAIVSVLLSNYASAKIHEESTGHLDEIYTQINYTFNSTMSKNCKLLKGWRDYFEECGEDYGKIERFIEDQKSQSNWNFDDFYFISNSGSYISYAGTRGNVELGDNLFKLFDKEKPEDVMFDTATPSGSFIVFAVPSVPKDGEKSKYKGFEYEALAMCFNTAGLDRLLTVNLFEGQVDFRLTYGDGRVIYYSGNEENAPKNYLAYLENEANIDGKTAADVTKDWAEGKSSIAGCTIDGKSYYLSYRKVGISDWMLVSIVPTDVVNKSLNEFTTLIIIIIAVLFLAIIIAVIVVLFLANKRRMAEKNRELEMREKLFSLLTANSNDIFVLFDAETFTSSYVSPNIKQVLGLDIDVVEKDINTILETSVSPLAPFTSKGLKALPLGRTYEKDIQLQHLETNEKYWFHMAMYHVTDGNGDGFILALSDRTKERKMSENLEDALNLAKSANEAKSNFLANMSHDIRTPMNAIVGFATLLAKDADDPEKVREYVKKISYSGHHLLSLINDILDMSKIESGKTTLNIEEFALPEFLEELYSIVAPQAKARKHKLKIVTKGNLPDRVMGDKLRLNQILINLLSNSVKYTPDGGDIELKAELLDELIANHAHIRITVNDNGIGMSEEFVHEIFKPFAREETARTKGIQGTGLGMAIVKNIVDLMGGTVSVESKLGEGSKFVIELELAIAGQKDKYDGNFWRANGVTRILVVDDEEDVCTNVKTVMEDTGVEIDYALSGIQAVTKVSEMCEKKKDYNVILLDWKMPEMDGVETARNIRKIIGREVPIIVLTSYDFDDIEEKAKEAGIDAFLSKPFFVSNFRNIIETIKKEDDSDKSTEIKPEPTSLVGLKVLAAEDNEINAEILVDLLDMEGAACDVVCNGKEVVDKFESSALGQYDVIFMDVQMPVMNGYEATRAIRVLKHPRAKTIPIIAMTANAFEDDVKQALESGMNAHLAKPIDMDKLKSVVGKYYSGNKKL